MGTVRASEVRKVRGSGIKRAGVEEGKGEGEDAFCASRVCSRESTPSGLRSNTLPCPETQLDLLFYFSSPIGQLRLKADHKPPVCSTAPLPANACSLALISLC